MSGIASSGLDLTRKQRSLILLFSLVAIGAGCLSTLLDISFRDFLYFIIVTMENTLLRGTSSSFS